MPVRYREPKRPVLALLYSLCFFIPVLGLLGFAIGAMVATWMPHLREDAEFQAVTSPHYELPKKTPVSGWRARLVATCLPPPDRRREGNPSLTRNTLGDSDKRPGRDPGERDVRLGRSRDELVTGA